MQEFLEAEQGDLIGRERAVKVGAIGAATPGGNGDGGGSREAEPPQGREAGVRY